MTIGAGLLLVVPSARQSDPLSAFRHSGLSICAVEALEPGRRFARRARSKAVSP